MASIKENKGFRNLWLRRWARIHVAALLMSVPSTSQAGACFTPVRPFVPSDSQAARNYADIVRRDFEVYFAEIQRYFRCLEQERARAFEEAREISQDYGRFLKLVRD